MTHCKKITPSSKSNVKFNTLDKWPKDADVSYSKLWVVLDGSKNPHWLEIGRPMIPQCEWSGDPKKDEIKDGQRIPVTMEILR